MKKSKVFRIAGHIFLGLFIVSLLGNLKVSLWKYDVEMILSFLLTSLLFYLLSKGVEEKKNKLTIGSMVMGVIGAGLILFTIGMFAGSFFIELIKRHVLDLIDIVPILVAILVAISIAIVVIVFFIKANNKVK